MNESGDVVEEVDVRQRFAVEVEYDLLDPRPSLRPMANLHFLNDQGVVLFVSGDHVNRDWYETERTAGAVRATCWIPGDLLNEGRVTVNAAVSSYDPTVVHARENDAVSFMVVDKMVAGGARGAHVRDYPGAIRPLLDWAVETEATRDEVGS